jgi:hypothetical protein
MKQVATRPGKCRYARYDLDNVSGMKNSLATLAKRNELRNHWRNVIDPDSFPAAIERVCRDCKQVKMCKWASEFTQTGKPVYKTRCDDCHNKYLNRLRKEKRPRVTSQALDRKYVAKKRCVDYLGGRCVRCGYDRCIKAMTFHHRDPDEKEFTVSQMLDRSWGVLRAELDKCDLLCFNCHMEEHCGIDQAARVTLGAPKKHGCMPHPETGDLDGATEPEAV